MKIERDEKFAERIRDEVVAFYREKDKPRTGKWHVSDLMFPRYAVLSRKSKIKTSLEEVGFFLTGEAYHDFMQKILGEEFAEQKGELLNVVASADYFDGDEITEFKTSRKWTVPEYPQDHYIEQAGYYATIFGKKKARIFVIFPTAGRKWDGSASSTVDFASWIVTYSARDIAEIKDKMKTLTPLMDKALKTGNVTKLPECPVWKFGTVKYDKEEAEYYIKVRCKFADKCTCGEALFVEMDRKNANRRKKKKV
jgi:hypothetical protein